MAERTQLYELREELKAQLEQAKKRQEFMYNMIATEVKGDAWKQIGKVQANQHLGARIY